MKGLIYVIAFAIGFAAGPASFPSPAASFAGPADQVSPSPGQSTTESGHKATESEESAPRPAGQFVDDSAIPARVVVDAPTKGRVGELIRFDLTKSDAAGIKWLLVPESVDFQVYENGRRAVFSARTPGEYMFIIAVANAGTVDVVTHTVKIEGPPPKPESTSLTEWVPYWLYPMQLDPAVAVKLAESFESVSDRITALSTPKGIIEATAEANRAALGDELDAWKPLLKKIQATLANRARANTLTTPEQHKAVWLEIAEGLRKYAG